MKIVNSFFIVFLLLMTSSISIAEVRYLHTDMMGSVISVSDEQGNIISRNHYDPFGKRIGGEKEGIGYTGHLQDTDLGLTYMQARYYDPLIGRFYSNDPVGFRDVHSFNRYTYANNNPYKYTDPTGMIPESFNEWKNFSVGVLTVAGAAGELATGAAGVVVGVADIIAGSKVVGALALAGGTYLIHDSKYTLDSGASKISDAWNNKSGQSKNQLPEGPLQSTAQDLGCSSDCKKLAGTIDKTLGMAAGKVSDKAIKGLELVDGLNKAGETASKVDSLDKLKAKEN